MVWDLAIDTDAAGVPAKGVPTGGADGVPRSGGGKGSAVGDALVGKSEVSDASHREPVTCVGWMHRNPEAVTTVTTAGVGGGHDDGTYELVSAGSDGRVLVWDLSDVSQGPVYRMRARSRERGFGRDDDVGGVVRGVFGAVSEPFRSRWSGFALERGHDDARRARFVLRGIGRRAGVQVRFKALAGDEKRVSGPTQGLRRPLPRCIRPSNRRTTAT